MLVFPRAKSLFLIPLKDVALIIVVSQTSVVTDSNPEHCYSATPSGSRQRLDGDELLRYSPRPSGASVAARPRSGLREGEEAIEEWRKLRTKRTIDGEALGREGGGGRRIEKDEIEDEEVGVGETRRPVKSKGEVKGEVCGGQLMLAVRNEGLRLVGICTASDKVCR